MPDSIHPIEPLFEMPSSAAQEYICLHAEEKSSAWNVAVRFLLRGNLEPAKLETAINRVVAQHEVLRTCFDVHVRIISQRIADSYFVQLGWFDLSGGDTVRESEIDRISKAEARRPFDLSQLPLIRAALVKLTPEEHVLLLTLHHAICDGWSIGILAAEIMSAYQAVCAGDSFNRDDAALQYADYAIAQNDYRTTSEYRTHAEFWRQELRGLQPAPAESVIETNASAGEVGIHSRLLPVSLTRQIEALAVQEGLTFFQVVLSAFALSRMVQTGRQEVVLATPVSGRNSSETEAMVGPFVNYLPVRLTGDPLASLASFRRAASDHVAALQAHAEFRMEDLLRENPQDFTRLFDHVFICQRDFVRTVQAGGVELTALPSVSPGALHGMTFFLVERADGWRASCEVDPSMYSAAEPARILDHFEDILSAFAAKPTATVATILRPGGERIATTHNAEEAFEVLASAAQRRHWTLQQVNDEASSLQLRIRLQIRGEFKAQIARQAFQALIDRHETLRTSFVSDGDTLNQRIHPAGVIPNLEVRNLFNLDSENTAAAIPELLRAEDHYVFDGKESSLLRVLILETDPSESILAVTLPHLVADGWSCGLLLREFYTAYGSLCKGQQPSFESLPIQYADFAAGEQQWLHSDAMQARLSWWRNRLPARLIPLDLPADAPPAARENTGAEVFTLDPMLVSAAKQFARENNATLFSLYGSALAALLSKYTHQPDLSLVSPFANRTADTESVVGPFATPVLIRTSAQTTWGFRRFLASFQSDSMAAFENTIPLEQCVELTSLQSRLGRHTLNQVNFFFQNAFVAETKTDSFTAIPLPLTGKGAAFEWQVGVIDYDSQLRIEFQYDVSLWSAASIRLVAEHYQRLLGECIFHPESPLSQIDIATEEEQALQNSPEQLLPISWRALNLRDAGKESSSPSTSAAAAVAPRSDLERKILVIWKNVFHLDTIGVEDDFFELGGHSLTLGRIQAQLKKTTGYSIHAADIFAAPTIATLAQRLGAKQNQVPESGTFPLRHEGNQHPLFLVSQSMVFHRMVQWLHPDQPVYAVVMQDEDLKNGAQTTFEEIAAHYVALIRSVRPNGPYRVGGWCVSSSLAYEIAQQLRAAGQMVDFLLLVDGWAPGYWRRIGTLRRLAAKTNYYRGRIVRHTRSLARSSFTGKMSFLAEKWRLMRAAVARQLGSLFYSAGIKVDVRLEEQTTFLDQVVYAASRKYQPRPGDFRALVFRSEEQVQGMFLPSDLGWSELLQHDVNSIALPGDHREIFNDPGAQILAQEIARLLSLPPVTSISDDTPASRKRADLESRKLAQPNACALAVSKP